MTDTSNIEKRGLPNGYLNKLEQRLEETELALYEALMELSQISGSGIPSQLMTTPKAINLKSIKANQSKTSRMQEWEQLPLRHEWQRDQWRLAKSQELSSASPVDFPGTSQNAGVVVNEPLRNMEDYVTAEANIDAMEPGINYDQVYNRASDLQVRPRQRSFTSAPGELHRQPWGGSTRRGPHAQRLSVDPAYEFGNSSTSPTTIGMDTNESMPNGVPRSGNQSEEDQSQHPWKTAEEAGRMIETPDRVEQLSTAKWGTYF